MANDPPETSADLRAQGNDLYKAGKIEEAIPLYQRAADLAIDDSAPFSNLSAAYFELGRYAESITASDIALSVLQDETKKQKINSRKVKSHVHCMRYHDAFIAVDSLPPGDEKKEISESVENGLRSQEAITDTLAVRIRILNELPRCKPQIRNIPEYFAFGHDTPASLYDKSLLSRDGDTISLLFGGIGDSRNLQATFVNFFVGTMGGKLPPDQRFHITICDHIPAVIARDLLLLGILGKLGEIEHDQSATVKSFIIPLLYYMFLSPIMPEPLHALLQSEISNLIEVLEDSDYEFKIFDVPHMYRPSIVKVLREWQRDAGEEYPTARVRKESIRLRIKDRENREWARQQYATDVSSSPRVPEGCDKEEAFYRKTGVLVMHWAGHHRFHEKELLEAYENFDMNSPDRLDTSFLDMIEKSWKTNPTFVDLAWQHNREDSHMDICVGHDPFEFGIELERIRMSAPEKEGLLNTMAYWFTFVAKGFKLVRPRIRIECCVGDVTAVLEQIRVGAVGHRAPVLESTPKDIQNTPIEDAKASASEMKVESTANVAEQMTDQRHDYPKAYDRIHLSNIPDYIGGTFATFLYAIPVLKPGKQRYVTANCLRNPPLFKSHDHFNNEYLAGLAAPSDLEKTFNVRMEPFDEPDETLIMSEYAEWHRRPGPKSFSQLLSRARIETWLFRFFLKIAIPKERPMRDFTLIYSPLNLTAFIRLCGHLHDTGYPAHWLSDVLNEICSGTIKTRARPPRSDPLSFEEVKATSNNSLLEQSTATFAAELTTLLSMWQFALPFGVLSPHIPPIQLVHKYSLRFPDVPDMFAEPPSFVLVLFDMRILPPQAEKHGIRQYLLSDEKGNMTKDACIVRKEGMHVVSTWNWDRNRRKVTFWFRSDVFHSLRKAKWGLSIWRTDAWMRQAGPRFLKEVEDFGPWIDVAENAEDEWETDDEE